MRLEIDANALADFQHWTKTDPRKLRKIWDLIDDCLRDPFNGLGKPEPLKHSHAGSWSRRIDQEHRLVYKVEGDTLVIEAARYHYG